MLDSRRQSLTIGEKSVLRYFLYRLFGFLANADFLLFAKLARSGGFGLKMRSLPQINLEHILC